MSNLKTVGYTVGGVIGTPFVEGFLSRYIPTVTDTTLQKIIGYAVKIGSAFGLGWAVEKTLGRDEGKAVLIGGLAYTGVCMLKDFGVLPTATGVKGFGSYGPRLQSQPLLGKYGNTMGLGAPQAADRLNARNRF